MDKNSIIGYVLIFVIFAGWLVYSSNKTELEQQAQQQEQLRLDSIAQANKIDSLERAAKSSRKLLVNDGSFGIDGGKFTN